MPTSSNLRLVRYVYYLIILDIRAKFLTRVCLHQRLSIFAPNDQLDGGSNFF